MFRISSIFTGAALALSLGSALSGPAAAQAQSVTVNIPFDFSAIDQDSPRPENQDAQTVRIPFCEL
jgi:hypothetical protein